MRLKGLTNQTPNDGMVQIIASLTRLVMDGNTSPSSAVMGAPSIHATLLEGDNFYTTALQSSAFDHALLADITQSAGQAASLAGVDDIALATNDLVIDGQIIPLSTKDPSAMDEKSRRRSQDDASLAFATAAMTMAFGMALRPGEPALTLSGHTISIESTGTHMVIDATTQWPVPERLSVATTEATREHKSGADQSAKFRIVRTLSVSGRLLRLQNNPPHSELLLT